MAQIIKHYFFFTLNEFAFIYFFNNKLEFAEKSYIFINCALNNKKVLNYIPLQTTDCVKQ